MKPARPRALNAGVAPREAWSWAMLDFANSGYTTVVLTAVFSAYFVGVVAGGAPWAALAWTEHLTKLPAAAAPGDDVFSDIEVANLLVLIGMINLWNRVMIGGRAQLAAA